MAGKPTSFMITKTAKCIENAILEETGLPMAVFHRKAIDYFLDGDQTIDDDLKITKRTNPKYVRKSVRELTYLDDRRRELLLEVAEKNGIGITVVLYQALINYCVTKSSCLPQEKINEILSYSGEDE